MGKVIKKGEKGGIGSKEGVGEDCLRAGGKKIDAS